MENNTAGSFSSNDQNQRNGSQNQNNQQGAQPNVSDGASQEQQGNSGQSDLSGNSSQNQNWNDRENQQEQQEGSEPGYRDQDIAQGGAGSQNAGGNFNSGTLDDEDSVNDSQI